MHHEVLDSAVTPTKLIAKCVEERRHFVQLDTDMVDDSFAAAFEHTAAAEVLTVFRNLAPEPGSNVQVWMPAGLSFP